MEHNEKKFKKQYFIFGSEISGIAEEEGVAKALKAAQNGTDFGAYCWDELSSPVELIGAYNGWEGFFTVTKAQFEKFREIE